MAEATFGGCLVANMIHIEDAYWCLAIIIMQLTTLGCVSSLLDLVFKGRTYFIYDARKKTRETTGESEFDERCDESALGYKVLAHGVVALGNLSRDVNERAVGG